MNVWAVWDFDPMDGSNGSQYLAKLFASEDEAKADAERRNAAHRLRFEHNAQNGVERAKSEPWNWKYANVQSLDVT